MAVNSFYAGTTPWQAYPTAQRTWPMMSYDLLSYAACSPSYGMANSMLQPQGAVLTTAQPELDPCSTTHEQARNLQVLFSREQQQRRQHHQDHVRQQTMEMPNIASSMQCDISPTSFISDSVSFEPPEMNTLVIFCP